MKPLNEKQQKVLEFVRERLQDDCGIQVLYRPLSGEKMV